MLLSTHSFWGSEIQSCKTTRKQRLSLLHFQELACKLSPFLFYKSKNFSMNLDWNRLKAGIISEHHVYLAKCKDKIEPHTSSTNFELSLRPVQSSGSIQGHFHVCKFSSSLWSSLALVM